MTAFQRASRSIITADPPSTVSVNCLRAKYKLTSCSNSDIHKYTNTNLAAYVGKVILIEGSTTCWQVTALADLITIPQANLTAVGTLSVTNPSTVSRSTGSWTADGVLAGMIVTLSGFSNPANNGVFTVATVGTSTLTVTATTLVTESGGTGISAGADLDAISPAPVQIQKDAAGNPRAYADCSSCGAGSTTFQFYLQEFGAIGLEHTSYYNGVVPVSYGTRVVVGGPVYFKTYMETDPNAASLFQFFVAEDGVMTAVFTILSGSKVRHYYPVLNGVRVLWGSGDADTGTSTTQSLAVSAGDMIQIGVVIDSQDAYVSDAADTIGKLAYADDTNHKRSFVDIESAVPARTLFPASGPLKVYADAGIPWSIVPPDGVKVTPSNGVGSAWVQVDSGPGGGPSTKRGVFRWSGRAFGVPFNKQRPLYFMPLAWGLSYIAKVPRHAALFSADVTANAETSTPAALNNTNRDQTWTDLTALTSNPLVITAGIAFRYANNTPSVVIADNGSLGDGDAARTVHITGAVWGAMAIIQAGEEALFTEAWSTLANSTSTDSLYFVSSGIAGVQVSPNLTVVSGKAVWDDSTTLAGSNPAKGAGKVTDIPAHFGYFRIDFNFEIINFTTFASGGYPSGSSSDMAVVSVGSDSSHRVDIFWRQNGVMDVWYWNGSSWSITASITPPGGDGAFVVSLERLANFGNVNVKINGTTAITVPDFLTTGTMRFGQVAGQFMNKWLCRLNDIQLLTDTNPSTLPDPV